MDAHIRWPTQPASLTRIHSTPPMHGTWRNNSGRKISNVMACALTDSVQSAVPALPGSASHSVISTLSLAAPRRDAVARADPVVSVVVVLPSSVALEARAHAHASANAAKRRKEARMAGGNESGSAPRGRGKGEGEARSSKPARFNPLVITTRHQNTTPHSGSTTGGEGGAGRKGNKRVARSQEEGKQRGRGVNRCARGTNVTVSSDGYTGWIAAAAAFIPPPGPAAGCRMCVGMLPWKTHGRGGEQGRRVGPNDCCRVCGRNACARSAQAYLVAKPSLTFMCCVPGTVRISVVWGVVLFPSGR